MFLGVDLGGTKTALSIAGENGVITDKVWFPTAGPEETIGRIIREGKRLVGGRKLLGIGISCGSPQDSLRGIIQAPPNMPQWVDVPIVKRLEEAFGAKAWLANDANACALAEWKYGAGRGVQNMLFLTFGTGLGAGVILNGKLYEGTIGMAGEIGHIRLAEEGPEGYGKQGSFEGFCSGNGIAQLGQMLAREKLQSGQSVSYCENMEKLSEITAKSIAECARKGCEDAIEVYRTCGERLGCGLSVLIDILNPERIVIGSIFQRAENLLREPMQAVIDRECLPASARVCKVVPAELGEQIGDYAALAVAGM